MSFSYHRRVDFLSLRKPGTLLSLYPSTFITVEDRQIANGGNAGGLRMGVITNMRHDMFRAVAADVPFVDVINTMTDAIDQAHRTGMAANAR